MSGAPLNAAVQPLAALWLWREVGQGMRAAADRLDRSGAGRVAEELRAALDQFEAAAGQLTSRDVAREATSGSGNAETEIGVVLARSRVMRPELTTVQAAERMGRSRERVVQLIHDGVLDARRHGRPWLVDPASVDEWLEARSA
jgi:excisionase family DNA binding protein